MITTYDASSVIALKKEIAIYQRKNCSKWKTVDNFIAFFANSIISVIYV